jgi:hypothetical protein
MFRLQADMAEYGAITGCCISAVAHAAFAGDWLKYGFVDERTQALLTQAALAGLALHAVIGGVCGYVAQRTASGPAAVAVLRGMAAGTPELIRAVALLQADFE